MTTSSFINIHSTISSFDNRRLNFWGIPKVASTSIKYALIDRHIEQIARAKKKLLEDFSLTLNLRMSEMWVHDSDIIKYISKEDAIANSYTNFSVIRNPLERFKSQFLYATKTTYVNNSFVSSIEELLCYLENTLENSRNNHFCSQYNRVSLNNKIIPTLFRLDDADKIETFLGTNILILNKTNYSTNLNVNQTRRIEKIYEKDCNLYESIM